MTLVMPSCVASYPPELLATICSHIFAAGLPTTSQTTPLDPVLQSGDDIRVPSGSPSSYPASNWSEPVSRCTLAALCLVNRSWYEAAKPWLWRRIEVRLPRSWLSLVEQIAGDGDEDILAEETARVINQSIQDAARAITALGAAFSQENLHGDSQPASDPEATLKMEERILETLSGPHSSIPIELLSPPASREPSPKRLRQKSKSPARWTLLRSIRDVVQELVGHSGQELYVPALQDSRPGRFVRHLDFNHFRTIGMRRSVEEGFNSRFVTAARLEALLKETPNLIAFGATEYMDGALTLQVLKEIFLRGESSRARGQPIRGRGLLIEDSDSSETDDTARRRDCRQLEAIDLTGCVSAVFVNALAELVNTYLLPHTESEPSSSSDEGNGDHHMDRARSTRSRASRRRQIEPLTFPGVQRLSLRGIKSASPQVLQPFILAFPSLTHLDISCTRIAPELLADLSTSSTLRLTSLSLGRCIRLTGPSIRDFLVFAPATRQITELSLYGDGTFPCPLSKDELREVLTLAPCFTSGKLVYLDLSSAELDEGLMGCIPSQPCLRSLGLSSIPDLSLDTITSFIKTKAPNVEVLTLLGTSPELGYGEIPAISVLATANAPVPGAPASRRVPLRQASMNLHTRIISPLCTPPFSLSSRMSSDLKPANPPTRLRVIELAVPLLAMLGAGAGSWKIVKSKGGRGWYVDTASGWIGEGSSAESVLRRNLEAGHPWRVMLEKLAEANGNVSSGVGWHARKMEVLHGHGLLGREDGLYGAVSFAYQG